MEITALLAGVGVAGIAIGLALQNVLGDLFASLSIVLDKPFVLGDFIIVDDKLGVVENIGLKTTRIRSLSGEQIVFSNADLLSSRIHNYKKMQERRVAFQFRVPYDTSLEQLRMIPAMVREIILNVPSEQMETWRRMCLQHKRDPEGATLTRFDRAHFSTIGDSALHFEIVYYVYSADYNLYMDVQQYINLEILRRFSENGIRLALPARTVHVERHAPQTPVPTTPPAEA